MCLKENLVICKGVSEKKSNLGKWYKIIYLYNHSLNAI